MLPWKLSKRHILPVSQNLSSVYFSLAKFQLVSCNLSLAMIWQMAYTHKLPKLCSATLIFVRRCIKFNPPIRVRLAPIGLWATQSKRGLNFNRRLAYLIVDYSGFRTTGRFVSIRDIYPQLILFLAIHAMLLQQWFDSFQCDFKSPLILWFILQLIRNNIRGELTVAHTKEQFSLKDNSFIEAVASSLKISSSKVRLNWVAPTRSVLSKLIIA